MLPLVVATLPISNNLNAQDLLQLLKKVVFGFLHLSQKSKIISYACDGTEVECSVQHDFSAKTNCHLKVTFQVLGRTT